MPLPVTPNAIMKACQQLAGHAIHTPLLTNAALDAQSGRRLFVKPECLQKTGSFKFRGAFNRLSRLSADECRRGVIAWSSGNHAQGVAAAAKALGIRARIVMPTDAPAIKTANTLALGAEVIPYDRYTEDREAIAWALAETDGAVIVPSFDDPHIIAGQGTLAVELIADCRAQGVELDALLVCCSGGGMVAGCALAAQTMESNAAIYAVEPEAFDDHCRSLSSGVRESVAHGAHSFCDALLAPQPGELTFQINHALLAGGLAVSDESVKVAMRAAFEHLKLVVEPGGAVALAAVLDKLLPSHYQNVGVVLSGGNVDPACFSEVIWGAPQSSRG